MVLFSTNSLIGRRGDGGVSALNVLIILNLVLALKANLFGEKSLFVPYVLERNLDIVIKTRFLPLP